MLYLFTISHSGFSEYRDTVGSVKCMGPSMCTFPGASNKSQAHTGIVTLVAKYLGDKLDVALGQGKLKVCLRKKQKREMRGETMRASPKSPGARTNIPEAEVRKTGQLGDGWEMAWEEGVARGTEVHTRLM